MLRISRNEIENGSVTLRLEGKITGPWVDETNRVCEMILANGQHVRMDLAQVRFADRAGVELLESLANRDAVLDNCSPFLQAQLEAVAGIGDPGRTNSRKRPKQSYTR